MNDRGRPAYLVRHEDAASALAAELLADYAAELADAFPGGYDPGAYAVEVRELTPPEGDLLVAEDDDHEALGCGALRVIGRGTVEMKRVFVRPSARGRGVGKVLLKALERRAGELGADRVVLDTSAHLPVAISMYRAGGYVEIEPYNDNRYAGLWFEKRLDVPEHH